MSFLLPIWRLRSRILSLKQPLLMGILNVTPDSFSDGGLYLHTGAALQQVETMTAAGADLIDIGGESTRPGSIAVDPEEEWRRLAPILTELPSKQLVPLSVDTRHGEVARRALDLGVEIINDISGGRDPDLLRAVAAAKAGYVLMHLRGDPATMMQHANYKTVTEEVCAELGVAYDRALQAGLYPEQIVLDPGFGFAKTPEQSWELLENLATLLKLGRPLLVGLSRKRMLRERVGEEPHALAIASAEAAAKAVTQGASIVRVHDVAETCRALSRFSRAHLPSSAPTS